MTSLLLFSSSMTLLLTPVAASFFSQAPCSAPCPSPCGGCPAPPPPPVCPQYPPCPAAAVYPQSYPSPQYVQPQLPQQNYAQQQQNYVQQPQYAQDFSRGAPQPTVIDLDEISYAKVGEAAHGGQEIVYESLPSGGSRLIVPQGAEVYALNAGKGAQYQYEQPMIVYRTANLPASGGYAAVEQNVDEMDLKGLEAGIPIKQTVHKRTTLEEIEKIVDELDEMDEEKLVRKVRALMGDDVISREDKEEERKDYGELISSHEEVEMIGGKKKRNEKKEEEEEKKEEDEKEEEKRGDEEINAAQVNKSKKHHEKIKKSRRSSKKAKAEESEEAVNNERDNDELDRKKCNSRRLYEIMLENMNESSASSKREINIVAEAEFGTSIDVICSRGHFSYVFSSNLYCEASKGHVTCIAFRQAPLNTVEQ